MLLTEAAAAGPTGKEPAGPTRPRVGTRLPTSGTSSLVAISTERATGLDVENTCAMWSYAVSTSSFWKITLQAKTTSSSLPVNK